MTRLSFAFLGLSITSSWGNGHATTYRGLIRQLTRRGHSVKFFERNLPFYAENRDLPNPKYAQVVLYENLEELTSSYARAIAEADVVIVGSYVPEGIQVGDWVLRTATGIKAFYDIDTPVTLRMLERGQLDYLAARQIPEYDLYLSFTGGPILNRLAGRYGNRAPRQLACTVDPEIYYPMGIEPHWDLGYIGTYSTDRQPALDQLLLTVARGWANGRFIVAGPQYPDSVKWPANVDRVTHLPPCEHRLFYNSQRFTLNITRKDMIEAGYSPSVRLFEAAASGVPIISDVWPGISEYFTPGKEILLARDPSEVRKILQSTSEGSRMDLAMNARRRVLCEHTAEHRAETLEKYLMNVVRPNRTALQRRQRYAAQGTEGST